MQGSSLWSSGLLDLKAPANYQVSHAASGQGPLNTPGRGRGILCLPLGCAGRGCVGTTPGEPPIWGLKLCRCRATEVSAILEACPLELSFPGEWMESQGKGTRLPASAPPRICWKCFFRALSSEDQSTSAGTKWLNKRLPLKIPGLEPLLYKDRLRGCFYLEERGLYRGHWAVTEQQPSGRKDEVSQ